MSSAQVISAEAAAMLSGRIMVVDDNSAARESLLDVLRALGHHVVGHPSAIVALEQLESVSYDLIITDLQMPGMTGIEFIRRLARRPHGAQIIMITAHATVNTAVEAMRLGAFDYLEKPFNIEQLERVVGAALERGRLLDKAELPGSSASDSSPSLIGSSQTMQALRKRIQQVARTNETVLITGESGTGKEMVARMVHACSDRAGTPLVSLNCPVLSAQLMESELFGHEKGAFTGADSARAGRFELAHKGTILLDEISEIELPLQAKLLRVLQERSFERVGSSKTINVDTRVLATSNRLLREEASRGRFREDLYFRLNVVPLTLPPLRERTDDVPELARFFLERAAARLQRETCSLDEHATALLQAYRWPGNVRELENLMTRASVLSLESTITGELLRDWLPAELFEVGISIPMPVATPNITPIANLERTLTVTPAATGNLSMQDMERQLIESTLERFNGHRAKTATALGIGVRTLSGKLKLYGYSPRAKSLGKTA